MNKEEIDKFLKAIDEYEFSADTIYRNKLIIKMIIYTGIRVSEMLNLKLRDIYKEEDLYILQVRGKGNKPRIAMIKAKIIENDLTKLVK